MVLNNFTEAADALNLSARMLLIYYVIFSKISVEQQGVLYSLLSTTLKMLLSNCYAYTHACR